ncbi:N-acetyltransferase eco isoform X2 [Bacillus rossius redtenbacheri]
MASFTPRAAVTSARKLFPRSPTSECESDDSLGHMSPLSSPDRYSSPPCTPEGSGGCPGNRAGRSPRTPVRTSPRNSRFDSLKPAVLSPLFVHRDIKRLRKHLDLNNTGELDKSFSKPADEENENTPSKSSTNTVIPQTPSQKSSKFGIVEESPNTPSVCKSPGQKLSSVTTGTAKMTVVTVKPVSDPSIPASVFYGKRSLTRELFPVLDPGSGAMRGGLGTAMKARQRYSSVDSLRSVGSNRSARGVARRKSRRVPGEINAGVFHKLRRPKPKKLSAGSAARKVPRVMPRSKAERYLRSAGLPVELTAFGRQVATPEKQQAGQGLKRKLPDPPTPPPDPSKKFFKTNRTVHKTKTVTFDGNIKVRVAEGKYSLNKPENPLKFRTRKVLKFKLFSGARSDCVFEAAEDDGMEQVNSSVRQLLEDLGDEPGTTPDTRDSVVGAGGVVIASAPEQASDEVVPGTPQKAQVIAEYVVGANGEIASPGLSFITSSLAISEDHSARSDGPGRSDDSAGLAVENPEGPPEQDPAEVSEEAVASALQPGTEVVAENVTLEPSGNECFIEDEKKDSAKKFFPVFYKSPERVKNVLLDATNKKTTQPGRRAPWRYGGGDGQYQIDAGQKRLGATQCSECGLVYSQGDMEDELAHLNYHNSKQALRFLGWKHERLVATHGAGRILAVHPGDPKSWWKKVTEVLEVVDRDLGYADGGSGLDIQGSKVFLYVEGRSVVGCLVAQPVSEAHRLQVAAGLDTCSRETHPVRCGVSRLWVVASRRRRGVASRLVDCMRANFMYDYILGVEDFAFSVPTVSGKEFGMKYTNKQNFLVYV